MRHLPFIAKTADAQVGKLVHALKRRGLLDETLVVITADHAAQTGRRFYGRFDTFPPGMPDMNGCDPATGSTGLRSDCNWYYGRDADEVYLDPSQRSRVSGTRSERTWASPTRTGTSAPG
jgi:arylsulfatase A-like enzyme